MAGKFNYVKVGAIAQTMLDRFGSVGQLVATDGVTAREVKLVKSKIVKYSLSQTMEGVQVGDTEFIASPVDETGAPLAPQQGEMIIFNDEQFTMMAPPVEIQPAAVIMLYFIYGRKGVVYAP